MYAVIRTGGKQYKVSSGDIVRVERLQGDVGSTVELSDVLMVAKDEDVTVGKPGISGAKVVGEIVEQDKGKKILVFKSKRRKNSKKIQGHRQEYTALRIKEIVA